MSDYTISKVYPSDKRANSQIEKLLLNEGIRRDKNLDYTCAVYDDDYNIIATGSCFGNTLRCMAVSHEHQGEGLMNEVVTHLVQYEYSRGVNQLFLYTKCNSAKFFGDLGFYEIVRIADQVVFMENRRTGFSDYLSELSKSKREGEKVAALVLNANPFTLGHQYLVEKASGENDVLHVFIVSEDASLVPFEVRKKLVVAGTSHL
ncbi:MAG: GNAT family N-acetyltransferase, partial [Synergistaceae bacterium]|nr:GNAT family N-acetyltransferase [Synergistaceae bacterium]